MKIGIISGASSGIGRCIATELDKAGLEELWLFGRSIEKLKTVETGLNTACRIFPLNLCDKNVYSKIEDELNSAQAKVTFLVISAGVGYTGSVEDSSREQISAMVETNCLSLTLMINTVLPYMELGGRIINIASGAGFLPQPDFAVYAASKSYVISLSRALREELKERKISVTAVCPGPVDTGFFSGLKNVKEYKKKYLISPERVAKGTIKAAYNKKAVYTPTLSMKAVRFFAKALPTSLLMKFCK